MNNKLFIFAFSLLAVSLYAGSDTCYSLQFQSSYSPLRVGNFPAGSKVLKIGRVYTVRYGCFDKFDTAKHELSRLKGKYRNTMITSTYKWRFEKKVDDRKNRVITKDSQIIENKPTGMLIEPVKQNYKIDNYPSLNSSQIDSNEKNIQKCYTVQLSLSKDKVSQKEFPIGTKIIKRGDFYSASYGCYTKINDAKMTLDEMRKKRPQAIIIVLPKSYFKQTDILPEIKKRGELLHYTNDALPEIRKRGELFNKEEKEEKLNFYKTNKKNSTLTTKETSRCSSPIERQIISCRAQSNANTKEFAWENVDKYAVEQYVDRKLNSEANMQVMQPYSNSIAINNELNETNKINGLLPFDGQFHYYVTATLNIENGQEDSRGNLLDSRSLTLSPGFTYLYNFSPSWYFYTDDRLIYTIRKSSTDLKLDVKELYVKSKNLFNNNANFLIGRKYLKDERGWYYKTSLDTIGISNKNDLLLYELYLGKRLTKNNSAYDPNEIATNLKDAKFLFAHLSYEYFKDNTIEGFFIHEDNKNAEKKLNWTGLRAQGKIPQQNFNMFSYWADVATMRGDLNQSSTTGLGFDIGAKYYFTNYFAAVAGSLAYGSGGGNLFVQPSFTNNRSNYLSKDLSFRYYGEFLQPELSNMTIGSLYFLRYLNTLKDKTVILALHNYTQDKHSSTQYNATNKTVNPGGKKNNIGNEIDLILHYDLIPNTYWRYSLGYFIGGDAYDNQTNKKDGFSAKIYFKYLW